MGFFIFFSCLLVIALISIIIHYTVLENTSYVHTNAINITKGISWLIFGISIIALVALVITLVDVRCRVDIEYANMLHTKAILEYRLNNLSTNEVDNSALYQAIINFDNEINTVKYWADNPWTNWFTNEKVATISPIFGG